MNNLQVPNTEEWGWTKSFEQTTRKWDQDIQTWCTKATSPDEDPPKSKHVRRIILALIRDPMVTLGVISKCLFNNELWKTDSRVAGKCFYIVLSCMQFVDSMNDLSILSQALDYSMSIYSNNFNSSLNPDIPMIYNEVCSVLVSTIKMKIAFHNACPKVHGNLYIPNEITEQIISELIKFAQNLAPGFKKLITDVMNSNHFGASILIQPIADEASAIEKCLKFSQVDDPMVTENLKQFDDGFALIEKLPFLSSAVVLPSLDQGVHPVFPRYPKSVLSAN